MITNNDYAMVLTTFADKESAKQAAVKLVQVKLAACVQMFPVESIYAWQGKINEDNETVLLIKTKTGLFEQISALIKNLHTYEVPEIIQITITDGLPEYLNWIDETLTEFSASN